MNIKLTYYDRQNTIIIKSENWGRYIKDSTIKIQA